VKFFLEEAIFFRLRAPAREIYEPLPAEVCTQVNLWRGNWKKRRQEWVVCVCVCGDLIQERVGLREGRRGRRSGEGREATWNPRRSQLGKQNAGAREE